MSGRIPALEAARGAAALMVVATHVHSIHQRDGVGQDAWLGFTSRGFLGVQVFFVLSGLVLYLPYARGRRVSFGDYARARLLRIGPALWVALAGAWLLTGIWGPKGARHALFLNARANYGDSPDPPAWSLTVEMGFYVLLPLLVIVFARKPSWRLPILAGLIATGVGMRFGLWHGWPRTPLSYVDNFAIGVLAAIVVARLRLPRWTLTLAAAALVAGLATPGAAGQKAIPLAVCAAFFAVTLAVLASVDPRTPRALVWLGTVSYGIYLWHWPILVAATDHGLYRLPDPLEIAVVAALAVLAGWASWRIVERPALAFARRRPSTPVTASLKLPAAVPSPAASSLGGSFSPPSARDPASPSQALPSA